MIQTINLDLVPSSSPTVFVRCSQYDKGSRQIQINIYNRNTLFNIPANSVVTVRGTKPQDNTGFEYECSYNGSIVTFPIQQQMTVYAGKIPAELRITKDGTILGSANFYFNVEESPLSDNTVISDTDLPLLQEAIDSVDTVLSYRNEAEASALDSEAWAVGERDGVEVEDTDPTYHNNSKYYSEQAYASEQSASQSSADALSYKNDAKDYRDDALGYKNDASGYKDDASASATSSQTEALKSEGYAIGKQNGADVSSGSPYYHNNAKYFSQEAENAKDLANTAINDISTFNNTTYPNAVQGVTDEGTRQIGLVGDEGTTQIGLVSAEGTTQVGLVEAKGEEVLESIPSDYTELSGEVADIKSDLNSLDNAVGVYDIGTTYNTLDQTYNRVMAVYPIKNVNDTFFYSVKDKSTNGTLSIRVCKNPTPYGADLLESVGSMGNDDTDLSGSFTISDSVKTDAKYITFLNATANLVVSFNVTMWTEKSVTGELKQTTETTDFLNTATMFDFQQYVQGGVNGTTGADASSSATVRPDAYFDVVDLVKVSLGSSSGLHVQLYSYGSDMSYLGRNDLGASAFSYTTKQIQAYRSAKYVRFSIYLDGGGNFSPTDLKANGKFAITLTTISAVPSMNRNTNTVFSNMLKKVGTTPMASWIDDDGVIVHTNGGINGVVLPVANAVGIPVTFALIPPLSDSITVEGQTMTKADYFKERQKEGHQIVSHPVHTYWYGEQYDITKVNPSLIECLTELQSNGFLHSDMLVYPGSSGTNADVVEIVRKWCICGVLSGYGTPNHLGDSTKWAIKRTFVNFEDYDSIHSSDAGYTSAMDWYKSQIDDAYDNGDWIIFGTHSYQFTTSTDTSDPNANTLGNLQMLMQYAVTKGLEFRTLWDAYNRRKYLFEFNEINQ